MTEGLRGSSHSVWSALSACALSILCALLASPAIADVEVGRTAGRFSVGSSGGANYSIPIFTPPGPRGIQPTLALTYSSSGGVGYLGRGWALSGLSSISRCPRNFAQDEGPNPWHFVTQYERYCLDGNRLRLQSGTGDYGDANSVYYTEVAEFSRITAIGTGTHGPVSWKVERADGLTYTYGGAANSNVVVGAFGSTGTWVLSEISDRSGNKVKYSWAAADSTTSSVTHPTKIEWTQTSHNSGNYVHSIDFNYGSGDNSAGSTLSGYIASGEILESDILNSITVSVSNTVVRTYFLTYETASNTGAKRLTTIKECVASMAVLKCLSDTDITYQNGTVGFSTSADLSQSGNITSVDGSYDFDGNGIKDLSYMKDGTLRVRMGATGGYGSEVNTGFTIWRAGKLLGNRADQLLVVDYTGYWFIHEWTGSSFGAGTSTDAFYVGPWLYTFGGSDTGIPDTSSMTVADVTGDGRDDLIAPTFLGNNPSEIGPTLDYYYPLLQLTVWVNNTAGGVASFDPTTTMLSMPDLAPDISAWDPSGIWWFEQFISGFSLSEGGDMDGDGRQELNLQVSTSWALSYFDGEGFSIPYGDTPSVPRVITFTDTDAYAFGDFGNVSVATENFNGDRCDDLVASPGAASAVVLSNCTTWPGGAVFDASNFGTSAPFIGMADWNGDGRKDFLFQDGSTLYVRALFGHNTLGTLTSTGISVSGTCKLFVTDGNGDGLDDIGCLNAGSGLTVYYHNGVNVQPDLATQFQDGYGVNHTVTYTAISRGSPTYVPSSSATYPDVDVVAGQSVVANFQTSDGIGGAYTNTYTYYGGKRHMRGRGYLGFEKIEIVDSRKPDGSGYTNGIKQVRKFSQTFPYTGMLIEEASYQPDNGPLISKRTVTPGKHDLDTTAHNERYFPFTALSTVHDYEVGGSLNGTLITYAEETNTFDTKGNLTESVRVVVDKDSGNSDLHDKSWTTHTVRTFDAGAISARSTNWCLGLPTEVSTAQSSTFTGETAVNQAKIYTPDYEKCRYTGESVGSGATYVSTAFTYDDFGNVNSTGVTGKNGSSTMTTRTTGTSFGTTGQFPVAETNALSQTTNRTFHSTFGSLVTETDPNGIVVVTNEVDDFGRPTRSIRPDGTATAIEYAACATYGCEVGHPASTSTGINKMIVITSERVQSGNSLIRDSWAYLDQFDRPLVQKAMNASGGYSRTGTQYDKYGRVLQRTVPCNASSCATYWVIYDYDLIGRPVTQSHPSNDGMSPATVTTSMGYQGRKKTLTDAEGKLTTKIFDVLGRLRSTKDDDNYEIKLAYDAAGSLLRAYDSSSYDLFTAEYSYGIKPFQTATNDKDLGSWTYSYNSLGELVGWTDAKSQTFTQTFDALSRVLSRTDNAESVTASWAWDVNSETGCSAGDIGQLVGATRSGYDEKLCYDSSGRLKRRTITTDDVYDIGYTYTTQGLLDTVTYPESTGSTPLEVKYCYDNAVLTSVRGGATTCSNGTAYWTVNVKNARGQTTQETLGNGVVTNRSFDAVTGYLNYIQSGTSGGGSTSLQNLSYAYNKLGIVTQRQESTLGLSESFCYDHLYRLTRTKKGTSDSACSSPDVAITYAANGNILSHTDVNGGDTWTYDSTKKHAITSTGSGINSTSYNYDANGNMITRGSGNTITWSSYNFPTGLIAGSESAEFSYGPDRQYYKQIYYGPGITETTHYVGGILEKVHAGSTTDWRHYVKAEGQTVAIVSRIGSSEEVYYPLADNQGSGSVLTDDVGTNLARQSYEAFGMPRDGNDWVGSVPPGDKTVINGITRRGYTGHSMLGGMGLIHMNGRVQDATIGRFLSPDPFIPDPGLTQSYNRYAYVYNNPLTHTDPSGYCPPHNLEWSDCFAMEYPEPFELPQVNVFGQRPQFVIYVIASCSPIEQIVRNGFNSFCIPWESAFGSRALQVVMLDDELTQERIIRDRSQTMRQQPATNRQRTAAAVVTRPQRMPQCRSMDGAGEYGMVQLNFQMSMKGWKVGGDVGTFALHLEGSPYIHVYAFAGSGPGKGNKEGNVMLALQVGGVGLQDPLQITGSGVQLSGFIANRWGFAGSYMTNTSGDYHGVSAGVGIGMGGSVGVEVTATAYLHSYDMRKAFSPDGMKCTLEP